jgi:hypothetical protein
MKRILRFIIIINIINTVVLKGESYEKINMANHPKIIHRLKYTKLKIANIKEDIKFNKTCLTENITPNFVQIKTKSKSVAALKTIESAKKIWLKEEVNFLYSKLNNLEKIANEIETEVINSFHADSIEEYKIYIDDWIQTHITKKKEIQKKKIQELIKTQKGEKIENNTDIQEYFGPCLQNLTNIEFNNQETKFLEKSLKYNVNLDHKPKTIEDELIELETSIRNLNKDSQDAVRYNFTHELNKIDVNSKNKKYIEKSNQDMKIIKSISNKLKENSAILTKADKSNTAVIMDKSWIYMMKK